MFWFNNNDVPKQRHWHRFGVFIDSFEYIL